MDARELQKLWHELMETALKNPNVEQFMRNLSFVISYLISEQDKRKELAKAMNDANEQRAKMNMKVDQLYERSEKNGKLLRGLITAIVSGIAIELVLRAFGHKP